MQYVINVFYSARGRANRNVVFGPIDGREPALKAMKRLECRADQLGYRVVGKPRVPDAKFAERPRLHFTLGELHERGPNLDATLLAQFPMKDGLRI